MKSFRAKIFRRPFGWLFGVYFATVMAFAVLYWSAWKTGDAFIVHDELNRFPTEELRTRLGYAGPVNPQRDVNESTNFLEGAELSSAIVEWRNKKDITKAQIADLGRRVVDAKRSRNEADAQAGKVRNENIASFKIKELGVIQAEWKRLSNQVATLELQFTATNGLRSAEGEYQLALARGNLAKAEIELSRQEARVADTILTQIRTFGDEFKDANYVKANETLNALENEMERLNREDMSLNEKGHALWKQRGKTVHDRIGFFDFVYFSLGVSTTSTFGDIMPNSRWARGLVTAQLFFCMVLVGILVSHIGDTALNKLSTKP